MWLTDNTHTQRERERGDIEIILKLFLVIIPGYRLINIILDWNEIFSFNIQWNIIYKFYGSLAAFSCKHIFNQQGKTVVYIPCYFYCILIVFLGLFLIFYLFFLFLLKFTKFWGNQILAFYKKVYELWEMPQVLP